MAILTPILTGGNGTPTYNPGLAETYSWVPIDNNQGRPMFAKLGYITNLGDIAVSLTANNLNIGNIHISDPLDTGLSVGVIPITTVGNTTVGAMYVHTQDFESTIDNITIGDSRGNLTSVTNSALNVFNTNPVSAISVTNSVTAVTVLNPVSSFSLTNPITAVSVTNFPTQLTAVSVTNQLTGITILNTVSSVSVVNQLSSFTVNNPITAVQVLNPVSAVSIVNQLTSTSVTVLNPVSSFSLTNQITAVSVTNPVSAFDIVACNVTLPVSGTVTITNSISTTPVGTQLVTFDRGPQLDTNNRLKVATPSQSWWYISSVDKDGDLRIIESFTTGASSIFVQNIASVTMTSGPSLTGSAIRASRRRFKVRPGVSHEWLGTVNFDGQDAGAIKRVGTFTNYNGMFFELSGTDFNVVVRRRLADGTLVEERVNQTNFNVDKLDGNGPSKQNWYTSLSGSITGGTNRWPVAITGDGNVYNASFTYSNGSLSALKPGTRGTISGVSPSGYNGAVFIAANNTATSTLTATYVIDPGVYSSVSNARFITTPYHNAHTLWFEFNGGRTAKVNFGINGSNGPAYLHQFDFSNQIGLQYESAPALMDRKEILNYSAMSYNPTMTLDGTSINIEAESSLNPAFVAAYNTTPITLTAGKEQPILGVGLRVGEPYQRSDLQVQQMNIIDTANLNTGGNAKITSSLVQWKLLLNPGLSGVPASTDIGKSSRQWAYTATTSITSQGIELMSGFATSNSPIDVKTSLNFLNMGSNINYTDADKVVLTAKLVAAGTDPSTIVGSINAIEAL
jgi:hypothetical protein